MSFFQRVMNHLLNEVSVGGSGGGSESQGTLYKVWSGNNDSITRECRQCTNFAHTDSIWGFNSSKQLFPAPPVEGGV